MSNLDFQDGATSMQDDELFAWVRALRLLSLAVLNGQWGKIGLEMNDVDASLAAIASVHYFDRLRNGASSFVSFDFSPLRVRPEISEFVREIGPSAAHAWLDWVHGTYLQFLRQGPPSAELNGLAEILNKIESGDGPLALQSNNEWLGERLRGLFNDVIVIDDSMQLTERDRGLFSSEGVAGSLSLEVSQLSASVAYGKFWIDVSENISDEECSRLVNFMTSAK